MRLSELRLTIRTLESVVSTLRAEEAQMLALICQGCQRQRDCWSRNMGDVCVIGDEHNCLNREEAKP